MKMRLYSFIIAGLLLVLIVTPVLAGYTISPTILAGQTTNVGVVKVTGNADGSLTLVYMLKGGQGWCMTETQVHVGLSLDDFPQNNGGAIPGQFDYKEQFDPCTSNFTLVIYDPPGDKGDVYIAIHLVVIGPGGQEETGWVVRCGNLEGGQFPGNNWSAWILFPAAAWE
jgi:hypothetical protein